MFESHKKTVIVVGLISMLISVPLIARTILGNKPKPLTIPSQQVVSDKTSITVTDSLQNTHVFSSLPTYTLQKTTEENTIKKAILIANTLGFQQKVPRVSTDQGNTIYRWEQDDKQLTYNISHATFQYAGHRVSGDVTDKKVLRDAVVQFLKANDLLPDSYTVAVNTPFVIITPMVQKTPIVNTSGTYPMSFAINADLSFRYIDYNYVPPDMTSPAKLASLTLNDAVKAIVHKEMQPFSLIPQNPNFFPHASLSMEKITLAKGKIAYLDDIINGKLQPVYIISGTYHDNRQESGTVEYVVNTEKK